MLKHQKVFATTRARFPLSVGAQGSGKSFGGIARVIFLSIDTPFFGDLSGNRGIIGRQSRQELVHTTMRDFFELIPDSWIKQYPIKPNYECILINDSWIQFVPLEELGRFKSHNLGFAFLEEIDEVREDVHEEIAMNRLRRGKSASGKILGFRSCFGVCNPTKNWVYDLWGINEEKFTSKNPEERLEYDPEYLVIHSKTEDNKDNLPKDFLETRRKYFGKNKKRAAMYLEGEWGGTMGSIYDWNEALVNDEDIWPPFEWPTIVGLDHAWGVNGVVAVTFLALERLSVGRTKVHVYDEIHVQDVDIATAVSLIDDHLQFHAIKRAEASEVFSGIVPERIPITALSYDPSMGAVMQRTRQDEETITIAGMYLRRAVERELTLPMIPADNKLLPGIDRIQWLIRNSFISWNPRCIHGVRQHRNYAWELDSRNIPRRDQVDDMCDATRYGVMNMNTLYHFPTEKKKESRIAKIRRQRANIAPRIEHMSELGANLI